MAPMRKDPARSCLVVEQWPEVDQRLWRRALDFDIESEDDCRAAKWRPQTRLLNRQGYGRWITYLRRSGGDLGKSPADRVTPEQVRAYLAELRSQELAPESICCRISQLLAVMAAIAPNDDWAWLKRRRNRLTMLVREHRRQRPLTMFTGDILDKALKALKQLEFDGVESHPRPATAYRNWLMVAMLALVPLRCHNFACLTLTRHLRPVRDGWIIEIPAEEAKQGREIVMPVPPVLLRHIHYYLEHVRPTLLAGRKSDHLWISQFNTDMGNAGVADAISNFTSKVFGEAINPHRFRHIGATTVVMAAPEMVEASRALLTHGNSQTTKDHYILGQSLAVGRQHATTIAKLRRRTAAAG